jgi:RNA polymerase sigma factor (sigma-70 family)
MKRRAKVSPTADEKLRSFNRRLEGYAVSSDERALLATILRKLDAETREIGLLYHLKGLTQEEVASEKGYSRKTIGKKLHLFNELFKKYWLEAGCAE